MSTVQEGPAMLTPAAAPAEAVLRVSGTRPVGRPSATANPGPWV